MKYESRSECFLKNYNIKRNYPPISSLYGNVNKITICIIDSCNENEIGKSICLTREDSSYIYWKCTFAQCLSNLSGMNLTDCVSDAVQKRLLEVKGIRISCGSPYEHSCDNYIVVDISIEYI